MILGLPQNKAVPAMSADRYATERFIGNPGHNDAVKARPFTSQNRSSRIGTSRVSAKATRIASSDTDCPPCRHDGLRSLRQPYPTAVRLLAQRWLNTGSVATFSSACVRVMGDRHAVRSALVCCHGVNEVGNIHFHGCGVSKWNGDTWLSLFRIIK